MSGPLAVGWSVDEDDHGLFLASPQGAFSVDATVAEIALTGQSERAGRLFSTATRRVLERVGAVDGRAATEHERPVAPQSGPRVSVIIPTFNRADLLEQCLRSLLGQHYAPIEIVIVDGGSTDGSLETIGHLTPDAVVVDARGNPGFAAACNRGVAASSGALLVLLNNDTVLEPDAIGQMVKVAGDRPLRLAAVNAMTRRDDLRCTIDSLGVIVRMNGFGAPRYAGFIDFGQFSKETELFSASFTCVMIPRGAWQLIGKIDERYGYYYEDVDWSLRARMCGMRIQAAPHALVYHVGSASFGHGLTPRKRTMVSRNRMLCVGKVLRVRTAVGFARRYAHEDLVDLRTAVRTGERETAVAIARALSGAVLRAPSVSRARKQLQRWHLVPDDVLFRLSEIGLPIMGPGDRPLLTAGIIRGHYAQLDEIADR